MELLPREDPDKIDFKISTIPSSSNMIVKEGIPANVLI